ncbi:MAG: hypothetical protein WD490_09380 [Opitutales bacterium]
MNLRIREEPDRPKGYFIRRAGSDQDRGPFSIESMKDLAEFDHLSPKDEVRLEDGNYQRLIDVPELKAVIFPATEAYHFKTYKRTEDKESAYAPIDAQSIVRCDNTAPGAEDFPIPTESM